MSQRSMSKAKCSGCGKECEVPFKPTPGKPVYCRECFATRRASPQTTSGRSASSSNFEPKQAWARRRAPGQPQTEEERTKPLRKFSHAP